MSLNQVHTNQQKLTNTHTHTQPFYCSSGICPGLPGWAGTRKVKPGRVKPIWIHSCAILQSKNVCTFLIWESAFVCKCVSVCKSLCCYHVLASIIFLFLCNVNPLLFLVFVWQLWELLALFGLFHCHVYCHTATNKERKKEEIHLHHHHLIQSSSWKSIYSMKYGERFHSHCLAEENVTKVKQ